MATARNHESEWAKVGARTRLNEIREEMAAILNKYPELKSEAARGPGKTGRKISAAARAAMSEGMRKYWARRKGAGGSSASKAGKGRSGRRKVSAEARAKMAAAQKARWAKAKQAQ